MIWVSMTNTTNVDCRLLSQPEREGPGAAASIFLIVFGSLSGSVVQPAIGATISVSSTQYEVKDQGFVNDGWWKLTRGTGGAKGNCSNLEIAPSTCKYVSGHTTLDYRSGGPKQVVMTMQFNPAGNLFAADYCLDVPNRTFQTQIYYDMNITVSCSQGIRPTIITELKTTKGLFRKSYNPSQVLGQKKATAVITDKIHLRPGSSQIMVSGDLDNVKLSTGNRIELTSGSSTIYAKYSPSTGVISLEPLPYYPPGVYIGSTTVSINLK